METVSCHLDIEQTFQPSHQTRADRGIPCEEKSITERESLGGEVEGELLSDSPQLTQIGSHGCLSANQSACYDSAAHQTNVKYLPDHIVTLN